MPKPFDYDHDLIPPEPNFFTAGFAMEKEDRYVFFPCYTMYDFHDSTTDIFVNLSFLPFCTQTAPWISFKNRYIGAKSWVCVSPPLIQN